MKTLALVLAISVMAPQEDKKHGKIEWARSLDAAIEQSTRDGRPVMTYWTFVG